MKMKGLLCALSLLMAVASCKDSPVKEPHQGKVSDSSGNSKDSALTTDQLAAVLEDIPKTIKPVLGYRFVVSGDFDGDGKKEKLIEHFFSKINQQETNKFYDSLDDYDQLVALTVKKEPYSFVVSTNSQIDTLPISSENQLLGLSMLKNEGDLNGDGTDEVSYVVNWADWSNVNTWHIVTYRNGKWIELYSFAIWDWQLPDLPETTNEYGYFGIQNKMIHSANDSVNALIEDEFSNYPGLVRKIETNTIEVIYRDEEANLDTMLVNIK